MSSTVATTLPLVHFNDVYSIKQKDLDVSNFAGTIEAIRNERWPTKEDGTPDGLTLFSGDVFNPSVESSVTRGTHMVPVLNALGISVACLGNHDHDFGLPHLQKLIGQTNIPWLLSNIVHVETGKPWTPPFWTTDVRGLKVGVIGLVEKDWIATVPAWDANYVHKSEVDVARELSKELRDPQGPHRVDLVIALTHSRLPNDIALAKQIGAVPASKGVHNEQGADIIFGGHDHMFYISKGCEPFEGYTPDPNLPGAEGDDGVLLVKSGTDFKELTELELVLEDAPEGSVRRKLISAVCGKRHAISHSSPSSPVVAKIVQNVMGNLSKKLEVPICYTITPWDVRSEIVRTRESAFGDWLSDILEHAYEDLPDPNRPGEKGISADCVFICGGSLRGDMVVEPGEVTVGDILKILPFQDPIVVLELTGQAIWDALESAFSTYPAQEGRFPVFSGFRITWDSTAPPFQRVRTVEFLHPEPPAHVESHMHRDGVEIDIFRRRLEVREPLNRSKTYKVVTREYMAQGYDGYEALMSGKYLVDDENGQIMSQVVRSYLLGTQHLWTVKQLKETARPPPKHRRTATAIASACSQQRSHSRNSSSAGSGAVVCDSPVQSDFSHSSQSAGEPPRHVVDHSANAMRTAFFLSRNEHNSAIDPVACEFGNDGSLVDKVMLEEKDKTEIWEGKESLAVVGPLADGRLMDVSKQHL